MKNQKLFHYVFTIIIFAVVLTGCKQDKTFKLHETCINLTEGIAIPVSIIDQGSWDQKVIEKVFPRSPWQEISNIAGKIELKYEDINPRKMIIIKNIIWLMGGNDTLLRYDIQKQSWKTYYNGSDTNALRINNIIEGKDAIIGLSWQPKSSLVIFDKKGDYQVISLPDEQFHELLYDEKNDAVWMRNRNEIMRFNLATQELGMLFKDSEVNLEGFTLADDSIWSIDTNSKILLEMESISGKFKKYPITDDDRNPDEDSSSGWDPWSGGFTGLFLEDMPFQKINLSQDNAGHIWVTNFGYLDVSNREQITWSRLIPPKEFLYQKLIQSEPPVTQYIWAHLAKMFQSSNGDYWFMTSAGNIHYDQTTDDWCKFVTFDNFAGGSAPMAEDSQGNIWLMIENKLYKLDKDAY